MTTPPLPEQIELHRDRMWRRDEDLRVESAVEAERFIGDVGFANTLTDARRAGPSLYIAVCGRRDVSLPRNVQKDEETRLTWYLKDEVMRRGRVYYAKLAGGRSMFVAPALIRHFAAVWMPLRKDEREALSDAAQRILKVLRREHELATGDLRAESGVTERAAFTRALDELQRQMICDRVRPSILRFAILGPSRDVAYAESYWNSEERSLHRRESQNQRPDPTFLLNVNLENVRSTASPRVMWPDRR